MIATGKHWDVNIGRRSGLLHFRYFDIYRTFKGGCVGVT
jgi:hypothetical protein